MHFSRKGSRCSSNFSLLDFVTRLIFGEKFKITTNVKQKTQSVNFTLMWSCIITNFFIIKPTRCSNFTNFILAWNSTCFGQYLCSSSGVHSLYTQQWYMSYRFVDSFRAGPGWNCSFILVLLESCHIRSFVQRFLLFPFYRGDDKPLARPTSRYIFLWWEYFVWC